MGLHTEAACKESYQDSTRQIILNQIIPFFEEKDISEIKVADLIQFRAAQLKKVGKKTINNRMSVLQRMLKFAVEMELLPSAPHIRPMKVMAPEVRWLSEREVNDLLEGADPFWRQPITFVLHTGLRIGELRALQWDAVDLPRNTMRIFRATFGNSMKITSPKSLKGRTIKLNATAKGVLLGLPRRGAFVFGEPPKYGILSYHTCRVALVKAANKAHLVDVGWHTLRHTFASRLAGKGVPLRLLQDLLGHSTLQMSMRYTHVASDSLSDAVALLDENTEE